MPVYTRTELDDTTLRLDIDLGVASYPIFLGENAPSHFIRQLSENNKTRRVAIIADETTGELFGLLYESMLITAGFEVISLTVAAGEAVKNWHTAGQVLEALAENRLERTDMVISLGGGVASDLAGFVAAVYQRGVEFAQISTTVLSMVDASVGGKTGVDLESGKNLAGAFKQPETILMDIDTLTTLPGDEFKSGLAEVVKTALLSGEEFCGWLEENSEAIMQRDQKTLVEMIARCIEFKAGVVASDCLDLGARECLNFGHTLGHALEKLYGYGKISHGAAVAQGMRFASRVSVQLAQGSMETVRRTDALLEMFDISPVASPSRPLDIREAMHSDKKVRSGEVRMVLLSKPGEWTCQAVPEDVLYDHLRAYDGMPETAKETK
ncbi:MAG: 3-dehydroquinate synthase [Coriobacteriia bacterium]|nr:3-dehydroquinate synthase [Coriobacteriia bacterium]